MGQLKDHEKDSLPSNDTFGFAEVIHCLKKKNMLSFFAAAEKQTQKLPWLIEMFTKVAIQTKKKYIEGNWKKRGGSTFFFEFHGEIDWTRSFLRGKKILLSTSSISISRK